MIKNIIFDMGRVLLYYDPTEIVRRAGTTEGDAHILTEELLGSTEWVLLDAGNITTEEAVESVCNRIPARLHENVRKIVYGWWDYFFCPISGMGDIICELKGREYQIYLLSNAPVTAHEYISRLPAIEKFSGCFISADWKLMKPQPEIFEKFCEVYGLIPGECLFIDDSAANTAGAVIAGMESIVFRGNPEKLRDELIRREIL